MDIEWLRQLLGKITYETAFAAAALLISIYSLYLSKKAMSVSGMTKIRPVEFNFWNNNNSIWNNSNSSSMKLFNTGPGVAYNVRLLFHSIDNLKVDPYIRSKVWYDDKVRQSVGSHDIQPNTESIYELNDNFLSFNHTRPLIISYELSSGLRIKTYWKYHIGEIRYEKFTKLNKVQIILYKITSIILNLRSPVMKLKRWVVFRKKRTSQDEHMDSDG